LIPAYPVYLFDIDGTLVDSAPDICGAAAEVMQANALAPVPFEILRSYIGLPLRDMFVDLLPRHPSETIDLLIQQYTPAFRGRKHGQTRLFPGVREGLSQLGGSKSTATTKQTAGTRLVLEHFGLIDYFDHVQGSDDMPYKPEPDVILAALAALGAGPRDCLLVGDSAADMEAGRRAGVRTCAVRYGYGDPAALARWTPDYWVSDLRELL
jgi:HAD superfamily hydrolase (TIGR01509 family)